MQVRHGPKTIPVTEMTCRLGESPIWDHEVGCLWWIDGVAGLIHRSWPLRETWSPVESFAFGEHVGSIALAPAGTLIAALEHTILLFDPSSGNRRILFVIDQDSRQRLNDGKTDRQGRFLCAGMGRDLEPVGALHSLDSNGIHHLLCSGLKVGNGLCFSPEGTTFYYTDTPDRGIMCMDYDPATGLAGSARAFIDLEAWGSGADGAAVDADGHLWLALVRAGKIARYDPLGQLEDFWDAPTDLPSSLAFGGPDLSTLYVTTICDSGTGRAVSRHPLAGRIFAIEGLGVRGLPEARFGKDVQIVSGQVLQKAVQEHTRKLG